MSPRQSPQNLSRRLLVVLAHLTVWSVAFLGAYLLRFDGQVPAEHKTRLWLGLVSVLFIRTGLFWWSGLFHGLLRYAGIPEVRSILRATTFGTIALIAVGVGWRDALQPRSILLAEWLLSVLGAAGLRLVVRVLRERAPAAKPSVDRRRVLLFGGGDSGELLLRDLERNPSAAFTIVGILDDDAGKQGSAVRGVTVLGPINEAALRRAASDLDAQAAILAIPSAAGARVREIFSLCRELGLEVKTLPSLQQIVDGDVRVSMLREVAIEDLLRRDPVQLDEESMAGLLRGKRVLITGGAGSIGSELARQAARHDLGGLALFDHNENALFFLERELMSKFPSLTLRPMVGDIKDAGRVRDVMRDFMPHVVLHAAAHKHVPLMEENPAEAIKNNVFGTVTVAELAEAFGVETFVLISTDKAVNPTSVMGTTKRIAEMFLQSFSERARTKFVAVRFGNVLGSAGSVVQIFREQIAAGGPVQVTHPDMQRYFMTIPEASQLVLQAAALSEGGEVFVLDMGEPVKVVDLARDMVRMSGLRPDVDIPIVFTGVRPGEKLFEELFHSKSDYDATRHPKIFVGHIGSSGAEAMRQALGSLVDSLGRPPSEVRRTLQAIVPEARFRTVASHERKVDEAMERVTPLQTLSLGTHTAR